MAVPLRSRRARDVQAGAVTAPELEWIEPLLIAAGIMVEGLTW